MLIYVFEAYTLYLVGCVCVCVGGGGIVNHVKSESFNALKYVKGPGSQLGHILSYPSR